MRSMVEGALFARFVQPNASSTACGGPPPRAGEELSPCLLAN
jgi:hypothetical protein